MESNEINAYMSIVNKSTKMRKLTMSDIYDNPANPIKYDYRQVKAITKNFFAQKNINNKVHPI